MSAGLTGALQCARRRAARPDLLLAGFRFGELAAPVLHHGCVGSALRLTQLRVGELIPGGCGLCHACASLLATGRSDPAPSVAAIGAWKGGPRVGGPNIQEARCDRCRRSASNGRGVRRPPKGTWPAPRSQEQAPAAACSGAQNRRHAGAERRPGDPGKGSRKPDGASREASSQRPSGPAGTGPGSPRGARVPVAPPCPAPGRRGKETARARCEAIGRRQ